MLVLTTTLAFLTGPAGAQEIQQIPTSVFGDGDPANGVEDSRQQVLGGRQRGVSLRDQQMNAGTVVCDGKVRGTAMVIDTRPFAPGLKGAILVSAAHVLYDLNSKQRFRRCKFHFLALSELSRYQAEIDLQRVKLGSYDPYQATTGLQFGEGDWAFLYVPKPWKRFERSEALRAGTFSFEDLDSFQQAGGELQLIAYDSRSRVISVSRHCQVVESHADDLGGGAWRGQLLDDCDSGGGSSGGGIVAIVDGQQYLVGIRNGAHWSEQVFPATDYPDGPPQGAKWDQRSNTNFARAFDSTLIRELEKFSLSLLEDDTLY